MNASIESVHTSSIINSNTHLTDNGKKKTLIEKWKQILKAIRLILQETTVEPCLFIYMACISMSSLAVQNMHLEKSCRIHFNFGEEICDRIRDRNTTGLEEELKQVQSLVAKVMAWKFPLQTGIPAVMILFIGAWSDKYKKRKILLLVPIVGEIVANIGLLLATYFFYEVSLIGVALIEALPAALSGSYIVLFMGMYSFISDRTTVQDRTFRLGIVSICVSLGTPTGTALSGILLKVIGYYGIFSLLLFLHAIALTYGIIKFEDVLPVEDSSDTELNLNQNKFKKKFCDIFGLVVKTVTVVVKKRPFNGRSVILCVLVLYLLMVGPLYGDSQVAYLYAIMKFNFTPVQYSVYCTINIILGLIGVFFCITILSKKLNIQDSVIGGLACISRIASSIVTAFAPNVEWYYLAPLFNIFSPSGLTAIRSIASKSVPSEEYAKLNSLIGVTEALAPSIYMPTSSYIYVSSIEIFPGGFYIFDASLTVLAIGFFIIIYILVKKKNDTIEREVAAQRKEAYARTNDGLEY